MRYAHECGSPARGGHAEARHAAALVRCCRERVNRLINGESADHVVFTLNTTDAMNLAIKGVVLHKLRTTGGAVHLITTELDHNSALRPLNALVQAYPGRITQTRLRLDTQTHFVDPDDLRRAIRAETALFVTLHASNVTGSIQPIEEYGAVCRERGVTYLVDAAQSLGHVSLDARACMADLIAFPGHKGLLGPTGTGGLYIRPTVERVLDTLREGGTGWSSEDEAMPAAMPERFEPGSHNTLGIVGLSEGVAWLLDRTMVEVRRHERELGRAMLEGLNSIPGLRLLGPNELFSRVGVFTFVHHDLDSVCLGRRLEENGVISRSGLHCAPLVHERYGTNGFAGVQGATRLSLGPFVSHEDVGHAVDAIRAICEQGLSAAR